MYATITGNEQSGTATSGSVKLNDPPATLALAKGARRGYVPGECSGDCYYYDVTGQNIKPGGYTITLYCNNSFLYSYSTSVPASGSFSYNTQNTQGHDFCGYPNTWVTLSGGPSGTVSSPTENFSG